MCVKPKLVTIVVDGFMLWKKLGKINALACLLSWS